MPNRLAGESSPYLLQHADNPVDWHPWGPDAFERARREDKPIFLSIGYSTCHWCHVMAHESFEDASVAAVLNRDFISIKLDREERPDVDRVYMTFVQASTGAGGWPMSVWLTPDLKPFYGGTYFPPSSRWGRPGFVDVLAELARSWRDERAKLLSSADTILERLREATSTSEDEHERAPIAGMDAIEAGITGFAQSFDGRRGGFGGAPKFPRPSELLFLFESHALTGNTQARTMATETLRAMALGGIRDHIGGGFHRYSVDAEWRVPHFEKMLYDQAQLVLAYLEARQATGDELYSAVAEDTLDYVLRDLTAPDGAFYSAEDADSLVPAGPGGGDAHHGEKREGAFYVWTAAEIDRLLGDDAPIVRRRFGIEDGGNAPADPQGEFRGQNIPYVAQPIDDIAVRTGRSIDATIDALASAQQTLFRARAKRPRPHLDDKVIAAWNGLMIAAFARAARVLVDSPRRAEWLRAAERAAAVVRDRLWRAGDRRLLRRFRGSDAAIEGFCEDYACLTWGLTELFQTTGDRPWLDWAIEVTAAQAELFSDDRDGGWFSTTNTDPSVLLRLKEDYDGAEPAAASVTVRNLITLGHLTGEQRLIDRAARTFERYGPGLGRIVRVMPLMVANLALWHGGGAQIVIAGPADADDTRALEAVVAARFLPWATVVPIRSADTAAALGERWPWLASMAARDGRATAYVCHDFVCRAPVSDPAAFEAELSLLTRPSRIILP